MENFLGQTKEKKGVNKALIIGALVGIVVIAIGIWALTRQPSMEDQKVAILEGSYREGSPEFTAITKDIIISTDPNTVESPNAFGSISMFIKGSVLNKGDKVINGLELNVAVVDKFNEVVKEERVLVVPTQRPQIGPGEIIPVTLSIDGFDKKDDRANIRWKVTAIRTPN